MCLGYYDLLIRNTARDCELGENNEESNAKLYHANGVLDTN